MSRLTLDEAVAYMRVSESAFRRNVAPHVPFVRIGRRKFYLREDLDAHATECVVYPAGHRRRGRSKVLAQAEQLPPLNVRSA